MNLSSSKIIRTSGSLHENAMDVNHDGGGKKEVKAFR